MLEELNAKDAENAEGRRGKVTQSRGGPWVHHLTRSRQRSPGLCVYMPAGQVTRRANRTGRRSCIGEVSACRVTRLRQRRRGYKGYRRDHMRGEAANGVRFVKKRKEWLDCLGGKERVDCPEDDDAHSIARQIWRTIWNTAAFRVIGEACSWAPPADEGGVQINGMLLELLSSCFWRSELLAIRRLVDGSPLRGEEGVYSVASLLKDMTDNQHLFTRGNIFIAEGRPYDYSAVQKELEEYRRDQLQKRRGPSWTPRELRWEQHEDRHKDIDALTGVSEGERRRDDTIPETVFRNLKDKLEQHTKTIHDYVDKYVAHSAAPENRPEPPEKLDLQDLQNAQVGMYHVIAFVSIELLGDSDPGMLGVPQYDHLKYIDKPLVASDKVEQMADLWQQYDTQLRQEEKWTIEDYRKEFGGV